MLLTFSKQEFKDRIIDGTKVHTFRVDKHNRWKVGMKIQFWLGSPRNTRGKNKPYQFGVGEVSRIETVRMDFYCQADAVKIGDYSLTHPEELDALAQNDGFDNWEQMKRWFDNENRQWNGKVIFWKNFETIN